MLCDSTPPRGSLHSDVVEHPTIRLLDKQTILIAEDRDTSRELLRIVLESSGYRVLEAPDGRRAVEIASETALDLVIMDIYMPFMNGFEALAALRALPGYERTPVIALTASAMAGERECALAKGFAEFLAKPVNLPELRGLVARLLGGDGQ